MPFTYLLLEATLKWDAIALCGVLLCAYGLLWLFNNNRLFFWCVSGALLFHLTIVGTIYSGMGGSILLTLLVIVTSALILGGLAWLLLNNMLLFRSIMASFTIIGVCIFAIWFVNKVHQQPEDVRIEIAAVATPPPPPPTATPPPAPTPPPNLALKQGEQDSKDKTKTPPKGDPNKKMGAPPNPTHSTDKPPPAGHVITTHTDNPNPSMPALPSGPADDVPGLATTDDPSMGDVEKASSSAVGPGEGGGSPTGTGTGIPVGWRNGRGENNKFYFIRLRYGGGESAWGKNADGLNRLLQYLKPWIKVEDNPRTMDSATLRDKYLANHQPPTFLYIYFDETSTFTKEDVAVLHQYLGSGGFLFVDSSQAKEVVDQVRSQLERVVPEPLERLSSDNPIYKQFTFSLQTPAVGQNLISRTNYGVARNGRLIVFYTPGNFSFFYGNFYPGQDTGGAADYIKATFQMGGNVISYALNAGVPPGNTIPGANATISGNVLQNIFSIGDDSAPQTGPASGISVKGAHPIKTPDPHVKAGDEAPTDVKIEP